MKVKNIEIRLIGSPDQLGRAVEYINSRYDILNESRLYPCRNEPEKKRQYLTVCDRKKEKIMI